MWKILIVDDERLEREFMEEFLLNEYSREVEIKTASNGEQAVELALLWKADIIFMDIQMPLMNGIEASKSIRNSLPDCNIIFLTAFSSFDYAKEGIQLKIYDYILKPVEDEAVIKVVNSIIGKEKENEKQVKDINNDNSPMELLEDYMKKHYYHDISLESVAETLSFSPYYLSKLFKQNFNMNFVEYLTNLRIDSAKKMLINTNKSIKEIGKLVGYPNSTYFVKLFKKKTNLTPSEYRISNGIVSKNDN